MGYELWVEEVRRAPRGLVLDLGAGHGRIAGTLLEKTKRFVVALDPYTGGLTWLLRKRRASVVAGIGEKLPFRDGTLAAAVSFYSFHHMEEPDGGVVEVCRSLKPGGVVVIVDWTASGSFFSPHSSEHLELSMRKVIRAASSGCLAVSRIEILGESYLVTAVRPG